MKKIIGIFVFTLLILTAFSSVGINNKQINEEIEINNNVNQNNNHIYDFGCGNNNGILNKLEMRFDIGSLTEKSITYEPILFDLPDYFSWMDYEGQDWTTSAKNQYLPKYCGSCWAFAALGVLECIINIREGLADLDPDLSEQYILSCLSISGSCNGGDPSLAYQFIKSNSSLGNNLNGIIPESCFPNQAEDTIPCDDKSEDWMDFLIPITDYGNFYPGIDAIKSKIMEDGPVVGLMATNLNFFYWGFTNHEPNDYYPYEIVPIAELDHAIIIVGWKDDPSIGMGGYWICKNSFGTGFGYDGFYNIEYDSLGMNYAFCSWVDYNPDDYDWHPVPKTYGPYYNLVGETIQFQGDASGEHPPFNYHWDFGDESFSEEQNPTHAYESEGKYDVTLTVTDDTDNSFFEKTFAWIQETNSPPYTPIIEGPAEIAKDRHCWYNITFDDPDDTPLYCYEVVFDIESGAWWGPYESGDQWKSTWYWNWTEEGDYIVKAKARDVYGAESDWATLEVAVPKAKQINEYNPWISRLIERFPILKLLI